MRLQSGGVYAREQNFQAAPYVGTNVARNHSNPNKKKVGPWQIDWSTGAISISLVRNRILVIFDKKDRTRGGELFVQRDQIGGCLIERAGMKIMGDRRYICVQR